MPSHRGRQGNALARAFTAAVSLALGGAGATSAQTAPSTVASVPSAPATLEAPSSVASSSPSTTTPGTPGTLGPAGPTTNRALASQIPPPGGAGSIPVEIVTRPVPATVTVIGADGIAHPGVSPLQVALPPGAATVAVSAPGREARTDIALISAPARYEIWLDPLGSLHHKRFELTTGSNPKQVAFTPDGAELWVPLLGQSGVDVFSLVTGTKLTRVALGANGGVEVIFTRDGATAYVSQMQTATVFEIDRRTRQIRRQFKTDGVWTKVLALSPDEKTLFAANWSSDNVSEIDIASGTVRRLLKTVRTPRGLAVSPDGRRLYVAGFEGGDLERIDLATEEAVVLIHTGGAMRHILVDPVALRLYADDMGKDTVFSVDLSNENVQTLAATDSHPNSMALHPSKRILYVSNRGQNGASYYVPGPEWGSVLAIDATSGRVLDAIVGGNQTTGLDVSPDGRWLAFTDFLDNKVQVYAIPPIEALLSGSGGRSAFYKPELQKPKKKVIRGATASRPPSD